MSNFNVRLNEALRGYHVGDVTPHNDGRLINTFRNEDEKRFGKIKHINTSALYSAIKYYKAISDRLSSMTKHDLIILVGNGLGKHSSRQIGLKHSRMNEFIEMNKKSAEILSEITGIPVSDFRESITLLIIGDQEQPKLSPWLILHQLGEGVVLECGDFWPHVIFPKYKKFFDDMPPLNVPPKALDRYYGDETPPEERYHPYSNRHAWSDLAFHHLFKMKSAREFIHGEFGNIDPSQEILTDYFWHRGVVRMNRPDWLADGVVDEMQADIEDWIEDNLNSLRGYRLTNESVQYDK